MDGAEYRHALEELRVADREALSVQGELEQNWSELMKFIRTKYVRRHYQGEIRVGELARSREAMELVLARIAGTTNAIESVPEAPKPRSSPLPGIAWTRALRHAREVHEELWRVYRVRLRIREIFRAWSARIVDIEALSELDEELASGEARRSALSEIRLGYVVRVFIMTTVWTAAAGFIAWKILSTL